MLCIDLTLSDDESAPPRGVPKRRRVQPSSSDSSDVVVVAQEDAKRQRGLPAGDEALGDEDLAVVGETGKTALRDFPHLRNTCCVNPFVAGVRQDNSKRCPQCFCYACDDRASRCEFWGTGLRARDHCNAHESTYWDAIREKRGRKDLLKLEYDSNDTQLVPSWCKSGSTLHNTVRHNVRNGTPNTGIAGLWARHASNTGLGNSQASHEVPATALTPTAAAAAAAAGGLAGHRSSTVNPATPAMPSAAPRYETPQQTPVVPAIPTASPWLLEMPHPRNNKYPVQLLAALELPIKTSKGLTIAELQRRLVPTGFYKGATTKDPQYGDHICLDNITLSRYVHRNGKNKVKQSFLELLPLVPPAGLPTQPNVMRTCKFIVISHEAGVRPVAVAVTVERGCLLTALHKAVREQLGSSITATEELVFVDQHSRGEWRWIRGEDARFGDTWPTDCVMVHYAFKVPKSTLPAPRDPLAVRHINSQTHKLAIVMHEKMVPIQGPSADSDAEDDMEEYLRALGEDTERHDQKAVRFGLPQVIVLDPSWRKGGMEAEKQLRKAIVGQLNAYCRPDQVPSVNSWKFTINRYSAKDTWRLASAQGLGRIASHGYDMEWDYDSPGISKLFVNWDSEPLVPPAGFDMDAFNTLPEVQDAEAQQRLAEMPKLMAEWNSYERELNLLQQMPIQVMSELKMACAAAAPPSNSKVPSNSSYKPSAIAVLSVQPADTSNGAGAGSSSRSSSSAVAAHVAAAAAAAAGWRGKKQKQYGPDRLGILRVEVYVFRHSGPRHRQLVENYENWSVEPISSGRNRFSNSSVGCQLKNVLNTRLLQEQDGYQLLKEVDDLSRTSVLGIKKLMDWVVTPEREAAQQPAGLSLQMHPYQLQSLKFMLDAEKADGGWRQLFWKWLPNQVQPPSGSSVVNQQQGSAGRGVWWSPVLDRVSYSVPPAPWGGFLAEEMGLGKTVEVLGLVLSNPAPPAVVSGSIDSATCKIVSRGTLVVCAVSLVGQWCHEAQKKLAGSLKMYPYHGQNRVRDPMRLATEYDLVVTTYATLSSDYGKNGSGSRNPLHKIKWHRVVFDEGHTVKNAVALQSKACVAVTSERRWICTGTPLSNDITDLLGQFSVLQMEPLGTKSWFDVRVKAAFLCAHNIVPLLYTLKHTMVRHTKAQTISGQSVLALPDKTEELVPVVLSNVERAAYLDVHAKAAAKWASIRHYPPAAINQRLIQIMSLLLPLRRICSGGSLKPADLALPSGLEAAAAGASHTGATGTPAAAPAAGLYGAQPVAVLEDKNLPTPEATECPICLDSFECPVMTPCHHWYCKECLLGVLSASSHCPLCRGPVDTAGLRAPGKNNQPTPVMVKKTKRRRSSSEGEDYEGSGSDDDDDEEEEEEEQQMMQEDANEQQRQGGQPADPTVVQCESKLKALIDELRAMRAADSSSKALVFSQYNSTLEWLKIRLPEEGFSFRTITGSMAQRQRAKAIDAFQSDPPTTVFLLSVRSGAVGINLTAASHVFLLEPCINPALEEQAIGRAWRMGQTRKVDVKRFYVKGSVEERIMEVRAMRQGHQTVAIAATPATDVAGSSAAAAAGGAGSSAAAAAAGADDDSVVRTSKGRKSIIGASTIAGNLKGDRQVLRIAELDLLFRTPELETQGSGGPGSSAAAAAAGS